MAESLRRAQRFRLGEAIGQSLKLSFGRLPAFLVLGLVYYAPYGLWLFYRFQQLDGLTLGPWWQPISDGLATLSACLLLAGFCGAVSKVSQPSQFRLRDAFGLGSNAVPVVLFYTLLSSLSSALTGSLAGLDDPVEEPIWILAVLVLMRVFAWVWLALFLFLPLVAIDQLPLPQAMARSWQWTRGVRIKILIALLAFAVVVYLLSSLVGSVLAGLFIVGLDWDSISEERWSLVAMVPAMSVGIASAAAQIVIYRQLSDAAQGPRGEELAEVFD